MTCSFKVLLFSEALSGLETRVRSGGVLENYYGVKLSELCFRRVDGSGRKDDLNPSVRSYGDARG